MEDKKVSGDEDKILTDVPVSLAALQRLKVDDSENMDKQHRVDHGDAIMAVPISFMAPQADVLLQHKIDEDKDAVLVDVSRSFIRPDESKFDALEHQVNDDEDATLMDVPISFIGFEESKADMFKQYKIDEDKDVVLVDVPISFIEPDESKAGALEHEVNDDEDATLIEVPISFIGFEESKADVFENEMIPKNMHYLHTHTFEQRRKNWIIKNTSRRDGSTIDYVYHHLETNKKFRSLVEVYKFVVDGEVRETKKKFSEYEETLQVTPKGKPRVRGNKLIKHYIVGTCTESSNGIYIKNRGEVNYLREIPSNIERKRKRENEDFYGHQQVNLGDDATRANLEDAILSTPIQSFLYLWDFELIQQKQKPVEMFPIPNIEDSKGKDSLSVPSTAETTVDSFGAIEAPSLLPDSEA